MHYQHSVATNSAKSRLHRLLFFFLTFKLEHNINNNTNISHLKAFVVNQNCRNLAVSIMTLKWWNRKTLKMLERTNKLREPKEIQSEATKLLRSEYTVVNPQVSHTSWALNCNTHLCEGETGACYGLAAVARRHCGPLGGGTGAGWPCCRASPSWAWLNLVQQNWWWKSWWRFSVIQVMVIQSAAL